MLEWLYFYDRTSYLLWYIRYVLLCGSHSIPFQKWLVVPTESINPNPNGIYPNLLIRAMKLSYHAVEIITSDVYYFEDDSLFTFPLSDLLLVRRSQIMKWLTEWLRDSLTDWDQEIAETHSLTHSLMRHAHSCSLMLTHAHSSLTHHSLNPPKSKSGAKGNAKDFIYDDVKVRTHWRQLVALANKAKILLYLRQTAITANF